MNRKKEKAIVWICYAAASAVTLAGIFIHPAVNLVGVAMLAGVLGYCMTDK
jgi:hypothetical protein